MRGRINANGDGNDHHKEQRQHAQENGIGQFAGDHVPDRGVPLQGIAKVQDAASRLNRIIVKELIETGENAVSINPSSCTIAKNGVIEDMFFLPIDILLDFDMVLSRMEMYVWI